MFQQEIIHNRAFRRVKGCMILNCAKHEWNFVFTSVCLLSVYGGGRKVFKHQNISMKKQECAFLILIWSLWAMHRAVVLHQYSSCRVTLRFWGGNKENLNFFYKGKIHSSPGCFKMFYQALIWPWKRHVLGWEALAFELYEVNNALNSTSLT